VGDGLDGRNLGRGERLVVRLVGRGRDDLRRSGDALSNLLVAGESVGGRSDTLSSGLSGLVDGLSDLFIGGKSVRGRSNAFGGRLSSLLGHGSSRLANLSGRLSGLLSGLLSGNRDDA
jgi:hypothetical protein